MLPEPSSEPRRSNEPEQDTVSSIPMIESHMGPYFPGQSDLSSLGLTISSPRLPSSELSHDIDVSSPPLPFPTVQTTQVSDGGCSSTESSAESSSPFNLSPGLSRSSSVSSVDSSYSVNSSYTEAPLVEEEALDSSDASDQSEDGHSDSHCSLSLLTHSTEFDHAESASIFVSSPIDIETPVAEATNLDFLDYPPTSTPRSTMYLTTDIPDAAQQSLSLTASEATSDNFQPGTSAETIRQSTISTHTVNDRSSAVWLPGQVQAAASGSNADVLCESPPGMEDEAVDGDDQRNRGRYNYIGHGNGREDGYGRRAGGDDGRGYSGGGGGYSGNGGSGYYGGSGSGSGGRGRDDGGDNNRRPAPPSSSYVDPAETSSESESEGETSDYSQGSPAGAAETSDDNVPLAQSIPTALTAQRTIRRQVRDEQAQRRRERHAKREQARLEGGAAAAAQSRDPRSGQGLASSSNTVGTGLRARALSTSRPPPVDPQRSRMARSPPRTGIPFGTGQDMASFSHAAERAPRTRTKTLPGNFGGPTAAPLAMEDLEKRLLTVQATKAAPAASRSRALSTSRPAPPLNADPSSSLHPSRSLRPSRSLHRPDTGSHHASDAHGLSRSATGSSSAQRSQSTHRYRSQTVDAPLRRERSTRVVSRGSDEAGRATGGGGGGNSRRPSEDGQRPPPMPPLPPAEVLNTLSLSQNVASTSTHSRGEREQKREVVWQQRVFVGDMQRFSIMEIGPNMTAREVVEMLARQGQLEPFQGVGGWMLFEVAQDFGMGAFRFGVEIGDCGLVG